MFKFCIGLAELFLLIMMGNFIRPGKGFKVEGLGGIIIVGMICYGLGALTLLLMGVK